jgi:excisionase family DNA binding protein
MNNKDDQNQLMTVREAAEALKVSPYTLLKWVRLEKIRVIRLSRKTLRFYSEDIRRWVRLHI